MQRFHDRQFPRTHTFPYNVHVSNLRLLTRLPKILLLLLLLAAACRDAPADSYLASNPTPINTVEPVVLPAIDRPESNFLPPQYAANNNLRFEHITVDEGLSQNGAYAIIQDSKGFMWFGTQDGLDKYDGTSFTAYKHDPEDPASISDNWILSIIEDRQGTLWIGTLNGGLNSYDRELDQFTSYRHDPEDNGSLSNNEVLALYEDSAGTLWVGTRRGLNKLDNQSETFVHYQHDPDDTKSISADAVLSIHEDREGALWVGTDGGLDLFDPETETFSYYQHDPNDSQSISNDAVYSIYEDQLGGFWLGTDGGLNKFEPQTERFTYYQMDPDDPQSLSDNAVRMIYEDTSGVLWIATYGGGLNQFNRDREQFTSYQPNVNDPHSLSHQAVLALHQDQEGVLWIGTEGGGLNKLFLAGLKFAYFNNDSNNPNSLSSSDVRGIHEDQAGYLWVATNDGLNRFDPQRDQWHRYHHDPDDPASLSSDIIGDIYEDQSGRLWIGTFDAGLNLKEPANEGFIHYEADPNDPTSLSDDFVTDIYEDREGVLWVGTFDGGLNRYDAQSDSFTNYQTDPANPHSLPSNTIFSLYEDRQGTLWIGLFGAGLAEFDRESERFTRYQADAQDENSLSNNLVTSFFEDAAGDLWLGTAGGLNKLDQQRENFTHYREKDGLPNDTVLGILEDEQGILWLSTNNGVSKFDPQAETFINYDESDGLQSQEFSGYAYHQNNDGLMFFGGINGLNAFSPAEFQDNVTIPPVVVTALTQGGDALETAVSIENVDEITLNWPANFFEFEFAALSFANPEENQYAYKLEGFDEDWNRVGSRPYGRYTNLPGGSYTLRLIGSNNDGIWNEEGATVKVTVVPPFWSTWWFRSLGLLAILAVVVGGFRLRVRNIEARSRELESEVVNRTKELAALNDVAAVVSRSLDLQRVLTNALEKTLEIMEIEAGLIYLLQEGDEILTIAAYKGFDAQFVSEIDKLQVGEGFSGRVVQSGEPLIVPELAFDPRLTRSVVSESDFNSLAVVPLVSRAKVLGTLAVIARGQRDFSEQDIKLLTSIGDQIGVAVENAQLYDQAQQAAVMEERRRLARELHDSVTQSLHGSTLMAEAAQRIAASGDLERTRGYLTRLGEISQQALKEMRLLVYELRPLALAEISLTEALQQRMDAVERRAGVEVQLVADDAIDLPDPIEEALYRIAQEALNNALRHASPTSVIVSITVIGEPPKQQVILEVSDDGAGFDTSAFGDQGGIGLESMKERAENLGGNLVVHSSPGEGTQVKTTIDFHSTTTNSMEGLA